MGRKKVFPDQERKNLPACRPSFDRPQPGQIDTLATLNGTPILIPDNPTC